MTLLSNRIGDYRYISQGKTRIPGVNDGEEFEVTDVSHHGRRLSILYGTRDDNIIIILCLTCITEPTKCDFGDHHNIIRDTNTFYVIQNLKLLGTSNTSKGARGIHFTFRAGSFFFFFLLIFV